MEKYFTDNEGNVITRREWFQLITKGTQTIIIIPVLEYKTLEVTDKNLAELVKFYNDTLKTIELAVYGALELRQDNSVTSKVVIYATGLVIFMTTNKSNSNSPFAICKTIRKIVSDNIREIKRILSLAESLSINIIDEE